MDKFINFEKFLTHTDKSALDLSFDEIGRIIGEKLCDSAYKYEAYWKRTKTHVFPNLISNCGFEIASLDLEHEHVKLIRSRKK